MNQVRIALASEVGRLEGVILHRPGMEIEAMTPSTIKQALYGDLLSANVAQKEYRQVEKILGKFSEIFYIDDLLFDALEIQGAKDFLLKELSDLENLQASILSLLSDMSKEELVNSLILGLPGTDLNPLYNLYFTRDIGACFNDKCMSLQMATKTRFREILLTQVIYRFHPMFARTNTFVDIWEHAGAKAKMEGGDFLVASENVFIIGQGMRSNYQGVEAFIKEKSKYTSSFHVITQELPSVPESFIHLDMAFTLLSREHCMVFAPLIMEGSKYAVHSIKVENGKISSTREKNIIEALQKLGLSYRPIFCGGDQSLYQEREQWHSGANFFAIAPGKIMGYERNQYTVDALDKAGFEVLSAWDVLDQKVTPDFSDESKPAVITIESSELVRGGGGCRCMTMPISRQAL